MRYGAINHNKADRMKRFLALFLAYAVSAFACNAAGALERGDLLQSLREEIKTSPVVKDPPTPAFTWTIEKQRTGRAQRTLTEKFAASADGLIAHTVTETRDGKPGTRNLISLRGLMDVDGDDKTFGIKFNGLTLPIEPGQKFSFVLTREGRSINKQCTAQERKSANTLHAGMPGQVVPIACDARGTYLGFEVRSKSELVWIEALNMFLPLAERASTPLGAFTETTRITSFALQ